MLRNIAALFCGLLVYVVLSLLMDVSNTSDYVAIVVATAVIGTMAVSRPWLYGGVFGIIIYAFYGWILTHIVGSYSQSFWRRPNGSLDLHSTFLLHASASIVLSAVVASLANHLVRARSHRKV